VEDGATVGREVGLRVGAGVSLAAIVAVAEGTASNVGLGTGVMEVQAPASRARAGRAAKKRTLGADAEVKLRRMVDLLMGRKCNR
jgi:hypothetical protein